MPSGKHVTTLELLEAKRAGRKIVVLTAYDALFAQLLDESGVDVVLVGDSVNTVLAGQDSTLSATLEQMIYHTRMVRAGGRRGAGGGRRVLRGAGADALPGGRPGHPSARDSHHRHRIGPALRRAGVGAARHAGVEPALSGEVREGLRQPGRAGTRRGAAIRRRGTRRPLPGRGAQLRAVIEIADPRQMRAWSRDRRAAARRVGLVPTMGYLHEG